MARARRTSDPSPSKGRPAGGAAGRTGKGTGPKPNPGLRPQSNQRPPTGGYKPGGKASPGTAAKPRPGLTGSKKGPKKPQPSRRGSR